MSHFERVETPTVMDGRVIRWREPGDAPGRGEISASRNCVMVSGYFNRIADPSHLEAFEDTLHAAWNEHVAMRDRR